MTIYSIEVIRDGDPTLCIEDLEMAMILQDGGEVGYEQWPAGGFTITTKYPVNDEEELKRQIEGLDGNSTCEIKMKVEGD